MKKDPSKELPENVRIVKASYALKHKAGYGGFDPHAMKVAEKRLNEAANIFPTVAAGDLTIIEKALEAIHENGLSREVMRTVFAAAVELKSHSAMFKFPLVASVADSLCVFLDAVQNMSSDVREIIELHLKTLRIAIAQGPRAITEKDKIELLDGLEKACAKALKD